jgi:hypothetical protein
MGLAEEEGSFHKKSAPIYCSQEEQKKHKGGSSGIHRHTLNSGSKASRLL